MTHTHLGELPSVDLRIEGDATPDAWRAALRSGTAPRAPVLALGDGRTNTQYGTTQIGYLCKNLPWFLGCFAGFLAVGPVGPVGLKSDQLAMCPINPARSVLDVLLAMDSFCSIFLFQPRLGPISETVMMGWMMGEAAATSGYISLDARSCHWRPAHTWRKRSQAK